MGEDYLPYTKQCVSTQNKKRTEIAKKTKKAEYKMSRASK